MLIASDAIAQSQHSIPGAHLARPCAVWALVSGKGGVGKTTLALALADALVARGERVSLVDLDPQAGLTISAGLTPADAPLTDHPQSVHGVELFASSRRLAQASTEAITRHVERAKVRASVVLLDLSPALTDASHAAALNTATHLLAIARTDAAGLPNVGEVSELARRAGLPLLIVPSMASNTGLARESEAFLRGRYADAVTSTVIPLDARAAEAAGAGRPLTQTARRSRAAAAIHALAAELCGRLDVLVR